MGSIAGRATRALLSRHASCSPRAIVVNSFGRSGSTLLYDAISDGAARNLGRTVPPLVRGTAWDLGGTRLQRGVVYKSHDLPPDQGSTAAMVVYTFGDPVDAALSTYGAALSHGDQWLQEHCQHLRVPPTSAERLLVEDALDLLGHLRAWLDQRRWPTAFIRYESMWEHQDWLSDVVGFEVQLPPRRGRREPELPTASRMRLRDVHAATQALVRRLPDIQLTNWVE